MARGLQRGGGGGDGRLKFALAHLYQRKTVARLRLGSRRLGAIRKVEHLGGVRAGLLQIALGDEAFGAQVEQIEPGSRAQAGRG